MRIATEQSCGFLSLITIPRELIRMTWQHQAKMQSFLLLMQSRSIPAKNALCCSFFKVVSCQQKITQFKYRTVSCQIFAKSAKRMLRLDDKCASGDSVAKRQQTWKVNKRWNWKNGEIIWQILRKFQGLINSKVRCLQKCAQLYLHRYSCSKFEHFSSKICYFDPLCQKCS